MEMYEKDGRKGRPKMRAADVIRALVEHTDLSKALAETGMTPARALALVEGKEGRRQLAARKALGRLQVELLAHRYGALAMYKLCGLLNEEEAVLRLKGAMAVLGAMDEGKVEVGTKESPEKVDVGKKAGEEEFVEEGEVRELMGVVAEVLGERRRARLTAPGEG